MNGVWTATELLAARTLPPIGGKARGLVELARLSMPVPDFVAVDATALEGGLSDAARETLRRHLASWGDVPVAVRSSAAAEDGAQASWAGQFETVLGVRGYEAVEKAIAYCVQAAGSDRVRAYADMHGLQTGAMAVVVQKLADGRASGVVFSRDPDDPERALISVGLGLGEGVVQGIVPTDTVRVDDDGRVETTLAHKDLAMRLVNGAMAEVTVKSGENEPALSDVLARTLYDYSRSLEQALGCPQDVEFTVVGGRTVG